MLQDSKSFISWCKWAQEGCSSLKYLKNTGYQVCWGSGRLQRAWACWVCKVLLCFSWGKVGRIEEKMQPGAPNACQCRGRGFSPWSRKIPHAMRQLSPCTTTTEPVCCKEWSPSAYSLCSVTRQATAMRSPRTTMRSSPWSLQSEKAHAKQQRPSAVKYKK